MILLGKYQGADELLQIAKIATLFWWLCLLALCMAQAWHGDIPLV
jgi:hypothetical protein